VFFALNVPAMKSFIPAAAAWPAAAAMSSSGADTNDPVSTESPHPIRLKIR